MFGFGDIARATMLFHSSDIDELMAEPPVAGAARGRKDATAAAPRLLHSTETMPAERPAMADPARSQGEPRRMRAAA